MSRFHFSSLMGQSRTALPHDSLIDFDWSYSNKARHTCVHLCRCQRRPPPLPPLNISYFDPCLRSGDHVTLANTRTSLQFRTAICLRPDLWRRTFSSIGHQVIIDWSLARRPGVSSGIGTRRNRYDNFSRWVSLRQMH